MISRSKYRVLVASTFIAAAALVTTVALGQTHDDPHAPPTATGASEHDVHAADPAGHAAPTGHADPAGHADPTGHAAPAGHADTAGHADPHSAGGHEAAGAHGNAHHGPEPINWTDLSDKHRPAFIALLVNFGLLAALYYTLGKKPVADGLKQRRITIGKEIEDARSMLQEAKERAKKYQADLKNADADAVTAKTALVAAGKGEVERLLSEAEERAERMKRDAERLIEQERKQLRQDLLVETIDLAVTQAHKLLERSTTPEDHARLANELLAELARKPAAPRVVPASPSAATSAGGAS